jgi:hypothetical protein
LYHFYNGLFLEEGSSFGLSEGIEEIVAFGKAGGVFALQTTNRLLGEELIRIGD